MSKYLIWSNYDDNTIELTYNDFVKNNNQPVVVQNSIEFPILEQDVIFDIIFGFIFSVLFIFNLFKISYQFIISFLIL